METPVIIPERVQQAREAAGLRPSEVAERVGVDPATVWSWENGRMAPRGGNAIRLAQVLGVALESLYSSHADDPTKPVNGGIFD